MAELQAAAGRHRRSRTPKNLAASADYLVRKSVWSFGGDGWAYDIGFGGLDHVFASGRDVNILVLDTEVYSNTGGQASKSTPRGAVAKFAAGGKPGRKKDLGMIAMSYGNVFVGQISMGANPPHAIKTIRAAESYRGTSLLIAFSHCIGWGIDMTTGMELQKEAVACGYWPLYHFDPRDEAHPFHLDSKKPAGDFKEFAMKEARFAMLARSKPEAPARLLAPGPARHQRPLALLRAVGRRGPRWPSNGGDGNGARRRQAANEGGEGMSVDLSTKYLGLKLKNPLVIAACPLTQKLDIAAAAGSRRAPPRPCFPSLFEEQITHDEAGNDQGPRIRHRQLRRGPHLLPRAGRLPRRPGKLPGAHRQGQAGGEDPRHRQPQRHQRAAGSAMPR